ncbi:hypothetical protein V2J09_016182 [Rumex salicifolius]
MIPTMSAAGEVMKKYACSAIHVMKAPLVMVVVQAVFAGNNVFYKLAAKDGMNLRILIAYRFIFAVAFISPLAYFLERKSRPKLTWTILGQTFLCGLLGGSLAQNTYLESLTLTSVTFASAMANLIPVITFILAVSFRLEKLYIRRMSGRAKVLGTFLGVAGAMLLTFYKGIVIKLWPNNIHLIHIHPSEHDVGSSHPHDSNRILGALMSLVSALSYASWLIIQAKMSLRYPSYYSSTALMSLMGAVQAIMFALIVDHNWEHWKLGWNIRLVTVAYSGVIGSGMVVAIQAWCLRLKGPLYVSIFSPLQLILVALTGSLMLDEKLYLGSVMGGILIVSGLYAVLWGKAKEMKMLNKLAPSLNFVEDPKEEENLTTSKKINTANENSPPDRSIEIQLGSSHMESVAEICQVQK